MKGMAELVLSLCELAEAEGRVLRTNVQRMGKGCALVTIAFFFLTLALIFVLVAIYDILAIWLPKAVLLLIMGFITALLAMVFFALARKNSKTGQVKYARKQGSKSE